MRGIPVYKNRMCILIDTLTDFVLIQYGNHCNKLFLVLLLDFKKNFVFGIIGTNSGSYFVGIGNK